MKAHERIWIALDTPDPERARELVGTLAQLVGGFKVGLQLFSSLGPDIVKEIQASGADVFLDLKLHDIPNTVAGAAFELGRLGVRYFTVHASGGERMIRSGVEAAAQAALEAGGPAPTCLAVSVLTSLDDNALEGIGLRGPASAAVTRLAGLARDAGAGGVVCSPLEVAAVRELFPGGTLVVPGIRPAREGGVQADDQARTATPAAAVQRGADLLVIGRPITGAPDPAAAAATISEQIAEAV